MDNLSSSEHGEHRSQPSAPQFQPTEIQHSLNFEGITPPSYVEAKQGQKKNWIISTCIIKLSVELFIKYFLRFGKDKY